MNNTLDNLNKTNSLTIKLILTSVLLITATASIAEQANTPYVDSVLKWGAWELDIEPAAGGLSQPAIQALNARNAKINLRTNSMAALAPPPHKTTTGISSNPTGPTVPATTPPVITTAPTVPTRPASLPAAPTTPAPPAATPPTIVILPAATPPTTVAPSGSVIPTTVALP